MISLQECTKYKSVSYARDLRMFDVDGKEDPPTPEALKLKQRIGGCARLRQLWQGFAQRHNVLDWDELTPMINTQFVDALQSLQTELQATTALNPCMWSLPKTLYRLWKNFFHLEYTIGIPVIDGLSQRGLSPLLTDSPFGMPSFDDEITCLPLAAQHALLIVQPMMHLSILSQLGTAYPDATFIVAVPRGLDDWKSQMQSLTGQKQGFSNVDRNSACTPHKPVDTHTHTYHSRTHTKRKMMLQMDWVYVIPTTSELQDVPPCFPFDCYAAALSTVTTTSTGQWYMPPLHCMAKRLKTAACVKLWDHFTAERQHLLHTVVEGSEQGLAQNMEKARDLLPYAPWRWARKIVGLGQAPFTPLTVAGYIVYAMVSRRYGTVYIGMVGKDGPRKLILQYYEHERECRAFQRVYGKRLKQHQLNEAMRHTGSSEWVMIPLQVCTEATVWRLEEQWMRTMGRVFNKERRAWRGQRWRMLAQNLKQHAESWSTRELRAVAHNIIHTHRCHTPAHT